MSENNPKKSFELRSYNPGDENAICALFEKVFGKPMGKTESIRHWQWEFLANPVKPISIMLAWDGDRLVGQYTASPVQMYVNGRNVSSTLSLDTMTDPEYGGLGIFRTAADRLYAEQVKAGQSFIYGFPNGNSIHGFVKYLQWHQIMPVPVHIRPVKIIKTISRTIFPGKPSLTEKDSGLSHASLSAYKTNGYKLRLETEFGEWADDLWNRCCGQHNLWVVRNKAYLNWRYVAKPENKYLIVSVLQGLKSVGYMVVARTNMNIGDAVFIVDFLVDTDFKPAGDLLIRYVINLARENECAFVSALLSPGSKYRFMFRKRLFLPLPERLFMQSMYFGARCFDPVMNEVVNDPKAWSISWGDNDAI